MSSPETREHPFSLPKTQIWDQLPPRVAPRGSGLPQTADSPANCRKTPLLSPGAVADKSGENYAQNHCSSSRTNNKHQNHKAALGCGSATASSTNHLDEQELVRGGKIQIYDQM